MTQNQIAYQRLQEDKRHNIEMEAIDRQKNRFGLLGVGISSATKAFTSISNKLNFGQLR